jgi:hypothetical protein
MKQFNESRNSLMQREILLAEFCDGSNCEGRWNKLAEFLGNKIKGNSSIRSGG